MIERASGRIMSICSIGGFTTAPAALVYVSSKWGLNGFMRCLQDELIANKCEDTVHLTTVYPDFIETRKELSETLDQIKHFLPRLSPEEVADAAVRGLVGHKSHVYVSHVTPLYFVFR
jgi:all-trans-retinol dehydrogenase (NAD+)